MATLPLSGRPKALKWTGETTSSVGFPYFRNVYHHHITSFEEVSLKWTDGNLLTGFFPFFRDEASCGTEEGGSCPKNP